ncbi:MAG: hypothetical protein QOK37_4296 [Thermoanaerobaculia bacterium]|jgi:uncharacterized protein YecE (DUF72 family)|nr:hypothetical protein [Thermoanaerobaculia bacterium]
MHIRVGTSGYSYKEWKGTFYPDDLPAAKMLPYYGERFDSVEINNTFYRMPDAKMVAKWGEQVPDGFTFVLKAPQRITHQKKLVGAGDDLRLLFEAGEALGPKLGPVLFQLPPFSRKDALKLREFVSILPPKHRVAFEFRHDSWFDDEIYGILRERDIALCAADTDEVTDPDALVVPTASWGYMRLRRTEFASGQLEAWAARVERQAWSDAYVFFKHEDEGKGPRFAVEFRAMLH